tara:strand:+ start:131 stop:889 length:759 start_codon:yes stop_codon:yes gene_type:complete
MADTYTDSTGKVFQLNAFGRPQGYWDGTKFVFPKFGTTTAAATPAVDPVVVPQPNPMLFRRQIPVDTVEGDDPTLGTPTERLGYAPNLLDDDQLLDEFDPGLFGIPGSSLLRGALTAASVLGLGPAGLLGFGVDLATDFKNNPFVRGAVDLGNSLFGGPSDVPPAGFFPNEFINRDLNNRPMGTRSADPFAGFTRDDLVDAAVSVENVERAGGVSSDVFSDIASAFGDMDDSFYGGIGEAFDDDDDFGFSEI